MVSTRGMTPEQAAKAIAREISRDADTQARLAGLAATIAADATREAVNLVGDEHDEHPFFATKVRVGKDRARADIWAANGPAIHAERKAGVLVAAAAKHGVGREGRHSKKKSR